MEVITTGSKVYNNVGGRWQINAPQGFSIIGAHTEGQEGMVTYGVNSNDGWYGDFFWQGGHSAVHPSEISWSSPLMNSSYLGWEVVCRATTCDGVTKPGEVAVLGLELAAIETSGPAISVTPGSLGTQAGWVRGTWPVAFSADGPSGACQLNAAINGVAISQAVTNPQTQTSWHQCPAGSFSQSVSTVPLPSGSDTLAMWARDAAFDSTANAYLSDTVTQSVRIDNDPVGVTLSGPTEAASTAGTQYLNVAATAGPSGVAKISCSLDGAPPETYPGANASVPVNGIGVHQLSCTAQNNAIDAQGNPASSPPAMWSLDIRQPTAIAASFAHWADRLRCVKRRERVFIPARWVTGSSNGHPVRVKVPAQWRTVTVVHCHPRIIRVRVRVGRHWRIVRIAVFPHIVRQTSKRIPFGAPATVSGWLGTTSGTALAGKTVRVLTAPDNGLRHFRQVGVATTLANGTWTATLPPGPSRLVEAVYGGSTVAEPAMSGEDRLAVPAVVRLHIRPRHVRWGWTIRIWGRVLGGYIPGTAQQLLRLRIGAEGYRSTVGIPGINRDGRFSTTWTFHPGVGVVKYWFSVSTLSEADYPYAPASSERVTVSVGRTATRSVAAQASFPFEP
jgi:hypothetical protein